MTAIALSMPSNSMLKALHSLAVYYYGNVLKFILTTFWHALAAVFIVMGWFSGDWPGALQALVILIAITSAFATVLVLIFEAASYAAAR